jgi:hypothetical protein
MIERFCLKADSWKLPPVKICHVWREVLPPSGRPDAWKRQPPTGHGGKSLQEMQGRKNNRNKDGNAGICLPDAFSSIRILLAQRRPIIYFLHDSSEYYQGLKSYEI